MMILQFKCIIYSKMEIFITNSNLTYNEIKEASARKTQLKLEQQ